MISQDLIGRQPQAPQLKQREDVGGGEDVWRWVKVWRVSWFVQQHWLTSTAYRVYKTREGGVPGLSCGTRRPDEPDQVLCPSRSSGQMRVDVSVEHIDV